MAGSGPSVTEPPPAFVTATPVKLANSGQAEAIVPYAVLDTGQPSTLQGQRGVPIQLPNVIRDSFYVAKASLPNA